MKLPPKKIPPPPSKPGTHTNEEVKEALHARALRRKIFVVAIVVLLLGCLLVVFNIASEYEGEDDSAAAPKMVFILTNDLSPDAVNTAMINSKAPFLRFLNESGGAYGKIDTRFTATGSKLVKILTGSSTTTSSDLSGQTSFLRLLVKAGFSTAVAAPSSLWSSNSSLTGTGTATKCANVGILDSECSGSACPAATAAAYCNANFKYLTCSNVTQLYKYELVKAFEKTVESSADVLFVTVNAFETTDEDSPSSLKLGLESTVNVLDGAVGQISLALAERTRQLPENWLIVLAGQGNNEEQEAPLFMAAYSRGGLIQLNQLTIKAAATDLYSTVLKWFSISGYTEAQVRGICSSGAKVTNC